jgi:DNA-binding SARP family transcriptional activator/DNA-binding NarL/FixJ family response regulator
MNPAPKQQPCILVVGNHGGSDDLVKTICTSVPCRSIVRSGVDSALAALPQHSIDCALLIDSGNQEIYSHSVRRLRQAQPGLPIFYLSNTLSRRVRLALYRLGVCDVFPLSIQTSILTDAIRHVYKHAMGQYRPPDHCPYCLHHKQAESTPHKSSLKSIAKRLDPLHTLRLHLKPRKKFLPSEPSDSNRVFSGTELPEYIEGAVSPPVLDIAFLGSLYIRLDHHPLDQVISDRCQTVLAFLSYHYGHYISRDRLMQIFWPDTDISRAATELNWIITSLQHLLQAVTGKTMVIKENNGVYQLDPTIGFHLDVGDFLRHWRLANILEREEGLASAVMAYERAAALYTGDFLEDQKESSWVRSERNNLRMIYLYILDRLSLYYRGSGRSLEAIRLCEHILQRQPTNEIIYRRLMETWHQVGWTDQSLRVYRQCYDAVGRAEDRHPERATIRLYHRLKSETRRGVSHHAVTAI